MTVTFTDGSVHSFASLGDAVAVAMEHWITLTGERFDPSNAMMVNKILLDDKGYVFRSTGG